MKQLLGVRPTTCNDIALVEAGVGDAKSYIAKRQWSLIHRLLACDGFNDTYVGKVVKMAIEASCPSGLVLRKLQSMGPNYDYVANFLTKTQTAIRNATSTRRKTYMLLNPNLSVNCIYNNSSYVPEHSRIACTRIRLSSHRLRVETGQWGRIPFENRTCSCGAVQTEEHVLLKCPLTEEISTLYPVTHECSTITDLLNVDKNNIKQVCYLCAKVLDKFN